MTKKQINLILLLLFFFQINAQESKVDDALSKHFNELRTNNTSKPAPEIIFNVNNEKQVIDKIKYYFKDSLNDIRSEAYYICKKIGLGSKELKIRQISVGCLLQACKDKDGGISGLASRYLTEFNKNDYNTAALDSLKSLLKAYPRHYENVLKLAGYLELKDMISFIKEVISNNSKLSKQAKWAGHLALARMRVEDDLQYCLKMVKSVPINDDVIYEMVPDLIYTRQKAAFEYLITILNSNELYCSSADPESSENIECGYRVMEMLAPVIADYPLELEASGDIKTDDYSKSLTKVREWFKNKKNDYVIKTETF